MSEVDVNDVSDMVVTERKLNRQSRKIAERPAISVKNQSKDQSNKAGDRGEVSEKDGVSMWVCTRGKKRPRGWGRGFERDLVVRLEGLTGFVRRWAG